MSFINPLLPTPSSNSSNLVDSFFVVGLKNFATTIALTRRDSQITLRPITNLLLISSDNLNSLPSDYYPVGFLQDEFDDIKPGNCAKGSFFGPNIYIYYTTDSQYPPITDIEILYPNEKPKDSQQYRFASTITSAAPRFKIAFSSKRGERPVMSLVLINASEKEQCPIDYRQITKDLNPGANLSDNIYLCFHLTSSALKSYQPSLLFRFPETDSVNNEVLSLIPTFCFPQGIIISDEFLPPTSYSFVLTNTHGNEHYGAVLQFYEPIPANMTELLGTFSLDSKLQQKPFSHKLLPKAICLLSHWPFYDCFKCLLRDLHRIAMSSNQIPIEIIISHFFNNVPLPPKGWISVNYLIAHNSLQFILPPSISLPPKCFSFASVLRCVSLDNIITITTLLMNECQLLFYSCHYTLLNEFAEMLRLLLFPFRWPFVFIPILPNSLVEMVHAIIPYMIGIHRSFLDELRPNSTTVTFDIDRNILKFQESKDIVLLPEDLVSSLLSRLESCADIYHPIDHANEDDFIGRMTSLPPSYFEGSSDIDIDEDDIRVAFLFFFVRLFHDYRKYLTSSLSSFLHSPFINTSPSTHQPFLQKFLKSQMFNDFITGSPTSYSTSFSCLLFFDWCCSIYNYNYEKEGGTFFITDTLHGLIAPPEKILMKYQVTPIEENSEVPPVSSTGEWFPKLREQMFSFSPTPSPFSRNLSNCFPSSTHQILHSVIYKLSRVLIPSLVILSNETSHNRTSSSPDEEPLISWVILMKQKIIDVWFIIFSSAALFRKRYDLDLVLLLSVLEELIIKYNIIPSFDAFLQLMLFCFRMNDQQIVHTIYRIMSAVHQSAPPSFYQSYYTGVVSDEHSFFTKNLSSEKTRIESRKRRNTIQLILNPSLSLKQLLSATVLPLPIKLLSNCICTGCSYNLSDEEIWYGWWKSVNVSDTSCPLCHTPLQPLLILYFPSPDKSSSFTTFSINLISPSLLFQIIFNELHSDGSIPSIFGPIDSNLSDPTHKDSFKEPVLIYNLLWYFQIFQLPFEFMFNQSFEYHPCCNRSDFSSYSVHKQPFVNWFLKKKNSNITIPDPPDLLIKATHSNVIESIRSSLKLKRIPHAIESFLKARQSDVHKHSPFFHHSVCRQLATLYNVDSSHRSNFTSLVYLGLTNVPTYLKDTLRYYDQTPVPSDQLCLQLILENLCNISNSSYHRNNAYMNEYSNISAPTTSLHLLELFLHHNYFPAFKMDIMTNFLQDHSEPFITFINNEIDKNKEIEISIFDFWNRLHSLRNKVLLNINASFTYYKQFIREFMKIYPKLPTYFQEFSFPEKTFSFKEEQISLQDIVSSWSRLCDDVPNMNSNDYCIFLLELDKVLVKRFYDLYFTSFFTSFWKKFEEK